MCCHLSPREGGELELEDDQSLLFSTLKSQWSTATGLFYRPNENADNNRSRGIKMTGEKFLPPKHGWGSRIYYVVTSDKDTTTKGINKSSIWIYTILGIQMNDMNVFNKAKIQLPFVK